ncbi:MAG: hypothetical protein CM15mP23_14180 [Cryomorphaceae bacterium]|nr:MAG: hypothetical protein CM15mP23_14180 [Cryomorphaceae bacterium]
MRIQSLLFTFIFCAISAFAQTVEYKVITTVESIVPGGMGRSRIVENNQEMDHKQFTTTRVDGKDRNSNDVKRKGLKINNLNETKLLNFYSLGGINFQNIASNDAITTSKLNELASEVGYCLMLLVVLKVMQVKMMVMVFLLPIYLVKLPMIFKKN